MAFDSIELEPRSRLAASLEAVGRASTALFVVEMLVKVAAQDADLLRAPAAYLRDGWNRLDFVIVGASVTSYMLGPGEHATTAALRLARVLRPLRVLRRVTGMRRVIDLLLLVTPRMTQVLLVYLLFLLIFAVLAVKLFAGRLEACYAVGSGAHAHLALDRRECAAGGGEWSSPAFGAFDSVPRAAILTMAILTMAPSAACRRALAARRGAAARARAAHEAHGQTP